MASVPPATNERRDALRLRDVTVVIHSKHVLDGIDLHVAHGTTLGLLGPSGCGKTTLLRAIAGLQDHGGTISWDGQSQAGSAPHQRQFGLVFQDQALFPHLDVTENVAFGLRAQGWSRAACQARVRELLDWMGLSALAQRTVEALSGGEAQRVALARALAPRPRLLMLDEPLSGLDRPLREQLLDELPRILSELRQTAVYVTHDQEEALAVSDRIAVMRAGRLEQVAAPRELYEQPATRFVAVFLGLGNLLAATVTGSGAGMQLETPVGVLPVPTSARGAVVPGRPVTLLLRPDLLALEPAGAEAAGTQAAAHLDPAGMLDSASDPAMRPGGAAGDPVVRAGQTADHASGPGDGPGDGLGDGLGDGPRDGPGDGNGDGDGHGHGHGGTVALLHGRLRRCSYRGSLLTADVQVADESLRLVAPGRTQVPPVGSAVRLRFDPERALVVLGER